eukprot:TRINITY_DN30810_c0_g1_i1.p2 TRINITY_DN30810_c0_g1~~TRINITY_DN30810_c0_g1_i1.p2  ORF type:complete len:132 (+),score=46.43 TRINITY_DN30810_c0_g1_i1:95-490(+)
MPVQQYPYSLYSAPAEGARRAHRGPAWTLALQITFADTDSMTEFERGFAVVAAACRRTEPGTLMYEWMRSDKDPLRGMLLERFADKEHAHALHSAGAAFAAFKQGVYGRLRAEGKATVSGESFNETGLGFA